MALQTNCRGEFLVIAQGWDAAARQDSDISDLFVYNYHSASGVCDMKFLPLLMEIMQLLLLLAAAPVFAGWVKMVKCWSQGRNSPSLLQPYRDIAKLFSKDVVLAENASWIFRFTPYIVFGATLLAGGIIPILSVDLPLSATADVIALVALFAIARFLRRWPEWTSAPHSAAWAQAVR